MNNNFTRISIAGLKHVLEITPTDRNIMLLGDHGIGKSQIVTEFYKKKGYNVITLFLGQMSDPGDITGLPYKREITLANGKKTERMDFLPPAWWDDEKPFCLFLDEINRGRQEILNVVMDLTLNKKIGGREMPKGSVVVAAANYGERYNVEDLDPALLDRFHTYMFAPTVEEWIEFAIEKKIDNRIISFITADPQQLDGIVADDANGMEITPSRRSWVSVDAVLKNIKGRNLSNDDCLVLAGIIGPAATGLFKKHINSMSQVDAKALLNCEDFNKIKSDLDAMTLQDITYLNDLIKNYLKQNVKTISKNKKKSEMICHNFYLYCEFLKKKKMNEAIAHIIQNLLKVSGPVSELLLTDDDVMNLATEFVDDTELV